MLILKGLTGHDLMKRLSAKVWEGSGLVKLPGTWNSRKTVCGPAKSLQSCPTLFDPMDCTPPGSSVHGILQARIMDWVAMPFYKEAFQFSSVTQTCPTLCNPMNRNTPGLPVHHKLPEFTQTHAHLVCDAIQPSHPLSSPSPPAPNPSQHQGLFQ